MQAPTIKLYEQDAFQTIAQTTLCGVEDLGGGKGKIALAESIFFAEGGGQPADRGTLVFFDAAGEEIATATVQDVHEKGGVLWHTLDVLPAAVAALADCTVQCTLDWAHRLDSMQQHSGEHILSGILHRLYGAENVGFHIGSEQVRMDTSCPLTAAQLQTAEDLANEIIWQNVAIETLLPSTEALAKMTYRSKKEIDGTVRIVRIANADTCACCGTHLRTTGQVGQIKILTAEHYKGGERLSVVCGKRALTAAQGMRTREAEIGTLLSAKPALTAAAVQRVYRELNDLKFAKQNVEGQLFEALAAQVDPASDAPAIFIVNGLTPDGLHKLATRLSECTGSLCAALCESVQEASGAAKSPKTGAADNQKVSATDSPKSSTAGNQKVSAVDNAPADAADNPRVTTGYCLAQSGTADLRPLCKALNAAHNGRGGGKPNICQGSAPATAAQITAFLSEFENYVQT